MNRLRALTAFSLVEVTLALGVAVFCLVAVFGLLPIGVNSSQTSTEQTVANGIISAVAADLRATPREQAIASNQFALAIPASGTAGLATLYFTADGRAATTLQTDSRYRLTLTFPATPGGRAATLADLKVSWPATAALANASGVAETFVALDRN